MESGRRRFRRSLMPKLLLVLVIAGVLVNLCVGGFFRLSFHRSHDAMFRNAVHYAQSLAAEIGSPPDTAKARAIASRYSLRIRYQGPMGSEANGAWESPSAEGASRSWTQDIPELESKDADAGAGAKTAWRRGRFYIQVDQGPGRFLFATDFQQLAEGHGEYLIVLILILSCVIVCAFFVIRRLLHPLIFLNRGVERIRGGDLGYQVPVCSRDELGDLGRSFNAMSTGLKDMVRSREQLLLDVSHELRSPLTRIKVALEMGPEGMAKESIRDDLGEMEAMISEILETARLDSAHGKLNLEDVDLGLLLSEAVADADMRAPGARSVPAKLGPGPVAKIDRARVRKVLGNILDNAVKFSQGRTAPVEASIEAAADRIVVRIKDRGVGIPADELPRLFEPFYRVDRSRSRETGGYGLGLSLCKRIMEAHGGSISITSREGEGTEVTLVFPTSLPSGAGGAADPESH
jgi:signal transduction histidine kinase